MLEYMALRSDTMSYETDAIRALSSSLKSTEGLKYTLKEFNSNINVLKALNLLKLMN